MDRYVKWVTKERVTADQITVNDLSKEFTVFTAYAIVYILIVLAFAQVEKVFPIPILHAVNFTDDLWYVVFAKILFLLVVPLVIYTRFGYTFSSFFDYRFPNPGRNLKVILISFIAGLIINLSYLPKIIKGIQHADPGLLLQLGVSVVIPFFAAALPEELFYRVILQTRIEKKYGWLVSILLSAALFSLFHFPSRFILSSGVQGTAGDLWSIVMGTLIPVFIAGVIFAFLWNRYRNLLLLLALHFSIDLLPAISSMLGIKY